MDCDVLVLAGLWNSGPQHWQSLWERKHAGWVRAPHRDWNNPDCREWVAELDAAIAAGEAGPPILVAHSLACALVAHWAASESALKVAGAFLVAPSDVEAPSYPKEAAGFGPMPMQKLPFPSIVVASSGDEYVSIERARAFAAAWGDAGGILRAARQIERRCHRKVRGGRLAAWTHYLFIRAADQVPGVRSGGPDPVLVAAPGACRHSQKKGQRIFSALIF